MTSAYLDTNVIIARYMPSDPNFRQVEKFFRSSPDTRYISEVSILELYCVFSRLIRASALSTLRDQDDFGKLTVDEKVRVAVEHALRTCKLKVIPSERTFDRLPASKQMLEIPHELFEAIRCSPEFGVKTLDALHLAYASAIKELVQDLETFATLDKDISARSENIRNKIGINVVTPTEI